MYQEEDFIAVSFEQAKIILFENIFIIRTSKKKKICSSHIISLKIICHIQCCSTDQIPMNIMVYIYINEQNESENE